MKRIALIVAAGRGTRMHSDVPKQYIELGGISVLRHTIDVLQQTNLFDHTQIVIHPDDHEYYQKAVMGLDILPVINGGDSRKKSVELGLMALKAHFPDEVYIHDAARPFISKVTLLDLAKSLETADGAFPAIGITDAMWALSDGYAQTAIDPKNMVRAQTPQAFKFSKILEAHHTVSQDFRDDVAIAVAHGLKVRPVQGDADNFKLTTQNDLKRAELKMTKPTVRTGTGYDVHELVSGRDLILCGIKIPYAKGLLGHSDADVAMHAITDALFGAIAEGDIGQWFPPSEAKWKDMASHVFLEKAAERVLAHGLTIFNIDCTVICEAPKLAPFTIEMRQNIADILQLDLGQVNVKATTSETLGFVGRSEGIAAQAIATIGKL